jgi:hypothetical protein
MHVNFLFSLQEEVWLSFCLTLNNLLQFCNLLWRKYNQWALFHFLCVCVLNSPSECFSSSVDLEKKWSLELAVVWVMKLSNQMQNYYVTSSSMGKRECSDVKPKVKENFASQWNNFHRSTLSRISVAQTFSSNSMFNERSLHFSWISIAECFVHKWLISVRVSERLTFIITELIGHWWLSHHFRASCILMPAISAPVFGMKLQREI